MSLLNTAKSIIEKLKEHGHTAYIAGGWVRDFLMQHPSDDIDIATSASVDEVIALFPKTIPVGVNFGIVVVVEDEHQFEVATFRRDLGYEDGRRPMGIEPSDPKEDAKRRDFTINGMFYDPIEEELHDFVGGKEDLKKGVVRAIGNPHERFLEDRLRMIRAVRYSSRFHFPIESDTMQAILVHADQLFPSVAYERIWQEFVKMARFAHFDTALVTLHRLNLLQEIFPEIKEASVEEIQSRLRHLSEFPDDAPVIAKVLELFPGATLKEKLAVCEMFRLSNKDRAFVEFSHKIEEALLGTKVEILDAYEWAKLYAHEHFLLILQVIGARKSEEKRESLFQEHKTRIEELKKPIWRLQMREPIVRSHHLKEQGVAPGRSMGHLLEEAERIAANESLEDLDQIVARLRDSSHWPGG
ncbi:MAG: CCA tRNA nucleotidyltransferase [Candidatus Algichlamydia australiensis]|nr:CCA tRNA nucleotidyltransferase [Chlamydiales bacterium]